MATVDSNIFICWVRSQLLYACNLVALHPVIFCTVVLPALCYVGFEVFQWYKRIVRVSQRRQALMRAHKRFRRENINELLDVIRDEEYVQLALKQLGGDRARASRPRHLRLESIYRLSPVPKPKQQPVFIAPVEPAVFATASQTEDIPLPINPTFSSATEQPKKTESKKIEPRSNTKKTMWRD